MKHCTDIHSTQIKVKLEEIFVPNRHFVDLTSVNGLFWPVVFILWLNCGHSCHPVYTTECEHVFVKSNLNHLYSHTNYTVKKLNVRTKRIEHMSLYLTMCLAGTTISSKYNFYLCTMLQVKSKLWLDPCLLGGEYHR